MTVNLIFQVLQSRKQFNLWAEEEKIAPPVGLEPTTSGLEVRRAIHCATEAYMTCMEWIEITMQTGSMIVYWKILS